MLENGDQIVISEHGAEITLEKRLDRFLVHVYDWGAVAEDGSKTPYKEILAEKTKLLQTLENLANSFKKRADKIISSELIKLKKLQQRKAERLYYGFFPDRRTGDFAWSALSSIDDPVIDKNNRY